MTVSQKKKSRGYGAKKRNPQRKTAGKRPAAKGVSAVFLDRDGTICEEVGYINHLDRLQVYPWTAEAIRKLNRAGLPVVVVTNQSGVGRGHFSESLVKQVHMKIALELAANDARLDGFYYCPHHPTATVEEYRKECNCRKPAPGMLEEAAKRFNIDLASSFVVGDSYRDVEMGHRVGAKSILVMTGYGRGEYDYHRKAWPRPPDRIAENLLDAVGKILGNGAGRDRKSRSPAKASRKA
jgi:D-glycero-D-manno-heptose 1,7-bisphosphate phosphatase